jgi:hypothetical protein
MKRKEEKKSRGKGDKVGSMRSEGEKEDEKGRDWEKEVKGRDWSKINEEEDERRKKERRR